MAPSRWRFAATVAIVAATAACAEQKPAAPAERAPSSLGVGLQTEFAEADAIGAVRGPVDPPPVGTYPAPPARVEGWIAQQQVDSIRAHGWDVWASITSPSGQGRLPVWETWYSGHEVYDVQQPTLTAGAGRKAVRDFERPQQFHHVVRMGHLRAGHIPTDRAEAITSFNRYTRTLAEYVWNHHYNDAAVLNGINAHFDSAGTPVAQRQISLSRDSVDASEIALKPVFQFIAGDSASAVPYWAGDAAAASTDSANPTPDSWKQGVVVDPTGRLRPGSKVWMSVNGQPADSLVVVPLQTFYHIRLTAADSANYSEFAETSGDDVGQGNKGDSASVAAMVRPGNIALLVAMHVTTKEISNWTWQTFWWSPEAGDSLKAVGRPASVRGVWRNYLMNVAYSMVNPPTDPNGTPNISYNPYLETNLSGTFTNAQGDSVAWTGVTTNCMTCHRMATWGALARGSGQFPTGAPYVNNGLVQPGDSAFFANYTKLDFLWSVTRAQFRSDKSR
jgi:hypothetical protein